MVEVSRPEAMVEFDYAAQEPDELTIRKGDIIKDIKTQPGGWWEGTLGDRRGMFPDNFVKIISETPKHKDTPPDATLRPVSGRRCKVLFSYQPANEDELLLQLNDVIDIIGEVEEGWWKGKLRDMVGVFPSNFVTEIDTSTDPSSKALPSVSSARHSRVASESEVDASMPVSCLSDIEKSVQNADAPVLPPKPVKELCRALFPYEAANDDELNLKEGDVIVLLSKEVADKGWWRGELRGRVGVFPDNFVEVIQQEEVCKKPERPTKAPLATTNRVRDTITKPNTSCAIKNEPSEPTSSKRSSEVSPRQEEKPSAFPPIPGKKPLLPLPAKKSQRNVSVTGKHQDISDQTLPNDVGTSQTSPSSYVVSRNGREEVPEFDSVERSAMLNHPTASRVKAPRRRLPTNVHSRDAEISSGLMNGNALPDAHEVDNATRNRPQSRVWENKNKAPWMEELKLNQAKKNGPGPLKSPTSVSASQRPSSIIDHPTSQEVMPQYGGVCQMSNTEVNTAAQPDHCPKPLSGVSPKHLSLSGSESRAPHLNSGVDQSHSPETHKHLASRTPEKSPDVVGRTESSSSLLGSTNATQGPMIPSVQYLELMEKIVRLEKSLEQQRATFTQALKDVTDKLNEERTRRTHLEQEIDKLTNLVTQV